MAGPLHVVDTSAWIEWLTGSALGQKLGKRFPRKAQCIVPTIVQLELSKWLVREVGVEQAKRGELVDGEEAIARLRRRLGARRKRRA